MMIKPIIGKWQIGIRISRRPVWMVRGFDPYIIFWFLKLASLPKEGELISKVNYKGLIFETWLFKHFDIIMKMRSFPFRGKVIVIHYPIKLTFK